MGRRRPSELPFVIKCRRSKLRHSGRSMSPARQEKIPRINDPGAVAEREAWTPAARWVGREPSRPVMDVSRRGVIRFKTFSVRADGLVAAPRRVSLWSGKPEA